MGYSNRALALLRIGFGLYWLTQGLGKTPGFFQGGQALTQFVQQAGQRAEPFYRGFLSGAVVPNAGTFGPLIALAELAVGISFVLGLGVRVSAPVAIWLSLNYMLLKGLASAGGSVDRLFLLASVVFAVTAAGLVWGLDGLLARRFAGVPILSWIVGAGPSASGRSARGRVGARQAAAS